jgi:adenylate kinase
LEEIAKQEAALLEARSAPLRRYLIDNVIPTLTQGLMEVSKVKPKDPVDYLVQILVYAVFVTEIVMSHA